MIIEITRKTENVKVSCITVYYMIILFRFKEHSKKGNFGEEGRNEHKIVYNCTID